MIRYVALLGLLAGPAAAQSAADLAYCENVGDVAEVIMGQRQMGLRASVVINAVNDAAKENGRANAQIETEMILLAYQEPRYSSPSFQTRAVQDFSATMEAGCLLQKRS